MNRKHVFIDWWEVDPGYGVDAPGYIPPNGSPYGVTIKGHKPVFDQTPLIYPEKPWEMPRVGVYTTVIKVGDVYHAWYEVIATPWFFTLCYAKSTDGVHWEKPNLGLHEFQGSKENNIVRVNAHPDHVDEGEVILYDEDAPESERFKMAFTRVFYENGEQKEVAMLGAVSPDGIHWTEVGKFFVGGDTQASLIYDKKRKKYVIMTKAQDPDHLIRRTMIYSESDDFRTFTKPRILMNGDPTDPPDMDIYQMSLHEWKGAENAYVLFPTPFHRTSDEVNVILATSRDLNTIHRPMGNTPILSRENGISGGIYSCIGMLDEGDGKWIHFCCPTPTGHNEGAVLKGEKKYRGIMRFIYREDGYTSLHAESHGGITTIPLQFGKELKINADIQTYGKIKIAVTDSKTNLPLEGFGFDDCKLEKIDNVSYAVTWAKTLAELDLSKRYRLKMQLFKCDVYSYTFLDCPEEETAAESKAQYLV